VNYVTRVTQLTVAPKGAPVFSEDATTITIEDEGGGEFVIVSQPGRDKDIGIMSDEWPAIRDAIDRMIQETTKGGEA
jgi:hypothetical protein